MKFDDEFVKTIRPKLLGVAKRLTKNLDDAEDLVQTTLRIGLEKLPPDVPESKRSAWLIRTLTNRFIDSWRKDRHIDRSVDVHNDVATQPVETPPRWARVTSRHLAEAVENLDSDLRQVYDCHVQGKKYREIAEELHMPLNTVGTRLRRARQRLRTQLLGNQAPGNPPLENQEDGSE